MEKKDKELQELYKIIDDYSQSNKMIETLSEQMTKREDEMKKKQSEMNSVLEKIKILEEENQILDELNKEMEEAVDLELEKNGDLTNQNHQLKEQVKNLKDNMQKY